MIAFIPVSAVSHRVPGKNLRELAGRPCWEWTLKAAIESHEFEQIIILSDVYSQHNYAQGFTFGMSPRITYKNRRKGDLCGSAWDSVRGLIEDGTDITLLLPTSPFRTAKDIQEALKVSARKVASVTYLDTRTARELTDNGTLVELAPGSLWRSTGSIQIWRDWQKGEAFWRSDVWPALIEMPNGLDIDTEEDWAYAERYADRLC